MTAPTAPTAPTASTDCGCGGSAVGTASSDPGPGDERTRYYPRQLVAAADLTQDQLYFREKHRRHNRMLHGWGIVCGVEVRASATPGCVDVAPGYVLGPHGDEIVVDRIVTVDLGARNPDGDAANGCVPPDPWCADVTVSRSADQPVYLAISYAEFACRPVQTATSGCGCGCEDAACEYSRLRDSYRIRVLDDLPDTYEQVLHPPAAASAFTCPTVLRPDGQQTPADCDCPSCGPCPTSPWVVLADVTVNGTEVSVDCDPHRRYVASFRDFYYACDGRGRARPLDLVGVLKEPAYTRLLADPARLGELLRAEPAKSLDVDVAPNSILGKKIADLTIADIAGRSRATFVADMAGGVSDATRTTTAENADEVWLKATAAKALFADG